MKKDILGLLVIILFGLISLGTCKKGWLDKKPIQSLAVPTTLKDCQAMLDNSDLINRGQPSLGEIGGDDYFLSDLDYNSRGIKDRNTYIWADGDVYQGTSMVDWKMPYSVIFYANTILETLNKITQTPSNQTEWNFVKGQALFARAYSYYSLAQVFCKGYVAASANSDLGLVLRTSSDINIPSKRSNLQETYDLIMSDLLEAKTLLPVTISYKSRASKPAAFAMLARAYLAKEEYENARSYADSCLKIYNTLMDFATDPSITPPTGSMPNNPFKLYNPEVIYHAYMNLSTVLPLSALRGCVDSTLIQSYNTNDLRRTYYFKSASATGGGTRQVYYAPFSGGSADFFSGLSTSEVYLIRAEGYARNGNTTLAMDDLNAVYRKRWKAPPAPAYVNIQASSANDALVKILNERRKELCFRGVRWTDLKRLNHDPQFAKTLKRIIGGVEYLLPPNSNKYAWPIPDDEILYSNIPQNPR